jgi:signal transduction histidine kinase
MESWKKGAFSLPFLRPTPTKSFSVAYVDRILSRFFSVGLLALYAEILINGSRQIEYLNQSVFYASVFGYGLIVLGFFISSWFASGSRIWLQALAIYSLLLLFSWPFQVLDASSLPEDFQPWIWWTIGVAAVAGGGSFSRYFGIAYVVALPILWFVLRVSELGGSVGILLAIENSVYSFLLTLTIVVMVATLRWEAGKVDSANQLAIDTAVESARVEALNNERARLDALVHDSVLTTLLVAAQADGPEQIRSASKSARDTMIKLEAVDNPQDLISPIAVASFFAALETSCLESYPSFEVTVSKIPDLSISSEVARALSEATFQAADNSLKHAESATKRSIRIRGQKSGLKIVISDNGRGFRPAQIPRNRIGIRSSIIGRVEAVGGKVFLDSNPGRGTNVVLTWGQVD